MRTGFSTEWIGTDEFGWQNLVLSSIVGRNVPQYFPLRTTEPGWLPDQFVVTDSLLRMTQAADR
jgi:hypothetical protein